MGEKFPSLDEGKLAVDIETAGFPSLVQAHPPIQHLAPKYPAAFGMDLGHAEKSVIVAMGYGMGKPLMFDHFGVQAKSAAEAMAKYNQALKKFQEQAQEYSKFIYEDFYGMLLKTPYPKMPMHQLLDVSIPTKPVKPWEAKLPQDREQETKGFRKILTPANRKSRRRAKAARKARRRNR